MKPLLPALLLAVVVAVPSAARDRDQVPAATPTGAAVSCVPIRSLGNSEVRNDRVIDFMRSARKGYRVTLPDACPGLGFERAFSYATSLSQLCKQDIITVLRQGGGPMQGASCGLAEFQPIELTKPNR